VLLHGKPTWFFSIKLMYWKLVALFNINSVVSDLPNPYKKAVDCWKRERSRRGLYQFLYFGSRSERYERKWYTLGVTLSINVRWIFVTRERVFRVLWQSIGKGSINRQRNYGVQHSKGLFVRCIFDILHRMASFFDRLFILERMSLARLVMASTQCCIFLALLIPHAGMYKIRLATCRYADS